jgi:hypothetical protein
MSQRNLILRNRRRGFPGGIEDQGFLGAGENGEGKLEWMGKEFS